MSRYIESLSSAGQRDAEKLVIYGLAYLTELHEGARSAVYRLLNAKPMLSDLRAANVLAGIGSPILERSNARACSSSAAISLSRIWTTRLMLAINIFVCDASRAGVAFPKVVPLVVV